MQVLIVDDDDFALSVLGNTLSRLGHSVVAAHDGREAMDILRRGEIRLVVTDWDMPGMNGIDFCRAVRREDLSAYVYIIMLTGREGPKQRMDGLCAGADDFLNKPLDHEELAVCFKTAERILSLETREVALFALAKLTESRDSETGAHIERVQEYTRLVTRQLTADVQAFHSVDDEYVRLIYQTSPLHDLGKVGIPDAILLKPGALTADEFEVMKTHTTIGARTLEAALRRFPNARYLLMARDIAATHHEKFDGSGYPLGLLGDQIPLCGRIVAIADVYDALTSRRVYKAAMSHEQAMGIIIREKGSHFDPEIVGAFLRAEDQIKAARIRLADIVEAPSAALPPASFLANVKPESNACGILIVEDDALLLTKLVELINATGEKVFVATNTEEAKQILAAYAPRVVISDWVMPGADGVELCRHVRAGAETQPTHFIMLTAHADKRRLLTAYEAGVDDFISKPFDAEELLAKVRAGLRAIRLQDEMLRKAAGSHARNEQLVSINSALSRLSITDELTGLFNRRHAMLRLAEQWSLAERYSRPLTVAIIDIDHFKKINDVYGHEAGDDVLRGAAGILRDAARGTDTLCRIGGEEFLIIFPGQTIHEARVCAERCREAMENHPFDVGGTSIKATISIGLAGRSPGKTQVAALMRAADQSLYAAKSSGRNRILIEGDAMPSPDMANADRQTGGEREVTDDPTVPPVDLAAVLKRCGGDPTFAAAVTERFCQQAAGEVQRIVEALEKGDADNVRRGAHSVKSMAAYMAADEAAGLAKKIEDMCHEGHVSSVAPILTQLREEVNRAIAWIAGMPAAAKSA